MGQCRERQFCLQGCPWSSTRVRIETPDKKKLKKIINKKFGKKESPSEGGGLPVNEGAIKVVMDNHKGFYSNLFLVNKKDGGFSPVINPSGLNHYIENNSKPTWKKTILDLLVFISNAPSLVKRIEVLPGLDAILAEFDISLQGREKTT